MYYAAKHITVLPTAEPIWEIQVNTTATLCPESVKGRISRHVRAPYDPLKPQGSSLNGIGILCRARTHCEPQMLCRLLTDFILIVHFDIVLFVLLGMLLTLIGLAARWRWVRNFWFRAAHLIAIVMVVLQARFGVVCPLTILENGLPERAG